MSEMDILTFFVRAVVYGMLFGIVLGILSNTKYLK